MSTVGIPILKVKASQKYLRIVRFKMNLELVKHLKDGISSVLRILPDLSNKNTDFLFIDSSLEYV
jgi:hypothetical protein